MGGEARSIAATRAPVTRARIAGDLRALGVRPGGVLLVHSSISALGWVCGGAQAVVEALRDALGPGGTLVVPTHTGGNSDPAGWAHPPVPEAWWPVIRAEMPAYDPALTPARGLGAVVELVRTQPGALRSAHPQVSFAALGPQAETITAGHALDSGFGERSPLARDPRPRRRRAAARRRSRLQHVAAPGRVPGARPGARDQRRGGRGTGRAALGDVGGRGGRRVRLRAARGRRSTRRARPRSARWARGRRG